MVGGTLFCRSGGEALECVEKTEEYSSTRVSEIDLAKSIILSQEKKSKLVRKVTKGQRRKNGKHSQLERPEEGKGSAVWKRFHLYRWRNKKLGDQSGETAESGIISGEQGLGVEKDLLQAQVRDEVPDLFTEKTEKA